MDSAQGRDLAPIFGELSQTEKLSKIKLPLKVISVRKISYNKIDRNLRTEALSSNFRTE